ncbi:MAG: alanine--tRNA ligase [Oligoflexia bacterium]|nr:alanine--tRNA ligase [Oligoflexia bacterium]
MKKLTTSEIRETFLSFFESKECTRVKSSSLVPINDPTLLFTSAGMVQFKDVFTGIEKRPYTRATTAQKCLRAGGKHNDLENVGFTARHHTFFEMLGNFSFGDYFKEEAIAWAWELVTEKFQISKEKLHISVFREDDQAYDIWHKKIGIPKERLYRFDEADNFWSAGDVGPCGPCSEIYIDRGESYNTGNPDLDRMGGDGPRYLEFYNLVFMQFNRDAQGNLSPLPKPSVDTGMGLERVTSILQDKQTNYEIDLFQPVFAAIESVAKKKYVPEQNENKDTVAMRVIADHLRATSFLIAEGVLPSNDGRGYVLRRILRRAVRYGKNLGLNTPFLFTLVESLVSSMGKAYPELKEKQSFIQEAIRAEESKFFETLEKGLSLLETEVKKLKPGEKLSGKTSFLLYDSFGFPLDLTKLVCQEYKVGLDEKQFDLLLEEQRQKSRGPKDAKNSATNTAAWSVIEKHAETKFLGYEAFSSEAKILTTLSIDEDNYILTDKTPFYAEGGGQKGDIGWISVDGTKVSRVLDTIRPIPNYFVHRVELLPAELAVGKTVSLEVDKENRLSTMANHSATHLLHWALKKVLGEHVKQAGSLVSNDLLRFDFAHFKPVSDAELKLIEDMINNEIFQANSLQTKIMDRDEAITAGAVALFGEKYDDKVRVVAIGDGFSTELCGGTHVSNTMEIGSFVIASESGVAAGVRRIIAYTRKTAYEYLRERSAAMDELRRQLKAASTAEAIEKIDKIFASEKELEKRLKQLEADSFKALAKTIFDQKKEINGHIIISTILPEGGIEALKQVGESLKDRLTSGVAILGAKNLAENKGYLMILVTKDLTNSYNAGKIIQTVAPIFGAKGGGKPEQAQAGGQVEGLEEALEKALSSLEKS